MATRPTSTSPAPIVPTCLFSVGLNRYFKMDNHRLHDVIGVLAIESVNVAPILCPNNEWERCMLLGYSRLSDDAVLDLMGMSVCRALRHVGEMF